MHRAILAEAIERAKRNAIAAEKTLKKQAESIEGLCLKAFEAEAILAPWRQVCALRASEVDRLQTELDAR